MMKKIVILLKILFLVLATYVVIVFISHFSVNSQSTTYQISQSFDAMIFKADSPAPFFAYFIGLNIVMILIFIAINFLFSKKTLKDIK